MGIQQTKKISQDKLVVSPMLTNKAMKEIYETGRTTVICPKCNTIPTLMTTSKDERTIISCECRYILNIEINM